MTDNAHLFTPLQLRSVSQEDGVATDWHLMHLGSRAVGGAGLIIVEATAVEPHGRISPQDLGLWNDDQAAALSRLARVIADNGAVPAIQLAHAGRKANDAAAQAPSALAYSPQAVTPRAMTAEDLDAVIAAFRAAAQRAATAGFQALEIHAAHGYLLHEFLSPVSNRRTDDYGGSFANRTRLALAVTRAVRTVWPERLPLLVRISATDWLPEPAWEIEQSVALARQLKAEGVDLIDCSSGGLALEQAIPLGPGYQVPFAARIRREAGIATGAVGLITTARHAEEVIHEGQADAVLIGRQALRDPYWPLRAAHELGQETAVPFQYRQAW